MIFRTNVLTSGKSTSNLSKAHVTRDSSGLAIWAISCAACNKIILRLEGVHKFEASVNGRRLEFRRSKLRLLKMYVLC